MMRFAIFLSLLTVASAIFNGDNAKRDRYKWMVGIEIDGQYVAGGVLINKRYVLTSASMVADIANESGRFELVFNDYNRNKTEDQVNRMVSTIYVHPDFNSSTFEADLALLEIASIVNPTTVPGVKRIPITTEAKIARALANPEKIDCFVTGWGIRREGANWDLSPILQQLEIDVISEKRCNKLVNGVNHMTSLCYRGTKSNRMSACTNDEGSPMVCFINRSWQLFSVYSYKDMATDGCKRGPMMGVRLTAYTDWIDDIIGVKDIP